MDQCNQIGVGFKSLVQITVEPVSSDENSELDSCGFIELSEYGAAGPENKAADDDSDCGILLDCKAPTSASAVVGSEVFECCAEEMSGQRSLSTHKPNLRLVRSQSTPGYDCSCSAEVGLEDENFLQIDKEQQPKRRNTITDIFKWWVLISSVRSWQ